MWLGWWDAVMRCVVAGIAGGGVVELAVVGCGGGGDGRILTQVTVFKDLGRTV